MINETLFENLNEIKPLHYFNGRKNESIDLGEVIKMAIINNWGNKSYQIFQNIMNDILTYDACENILNQSFETLAIKKQDVAMVPELIILTDFRLIVETFKEQISEVIILKTKQLSKSIDLQVKHLVGEELELLYLIYAKNIKKIENDIIEKLQLNSLTNKEIISLEINDDNIYNSIMALNL